MKKYKIFYMAISIIIFSWQTANSKDMLTQEMYSKLCGVWEPSREKNFDSTEDLSWGKADTNTNYSTVIDLGEDTPFFFTGGMGEFKITDLKKTDEKNFIIEILFRDHKKYKLEITFIEEDAFIFKEMDWFKTIKFLWSGSGNKNIYYRHSKPKIIFYESTVRKLRLRTDQSQKSKVIRFLDMNEKLLIIKTGKKEKINNKYGTWVKILSDKNDTGWCFNVYLSPLK